MSILFVITLLCFFALFGAMLVVVRHVRVSGARISWRFDPSGAPRPGDPLQLQPAEHPNLLRKEPDLRFLASGAKRPGRRLGLAAFLSHTRTSPSPSRQEIPLRADRAYFNEDLGDLSDPYEPRRTPAGDRSTNL